MRTVESHQLAVELLFAGKSLLEKHPQRGWEDTGVGDPACSLMTNPDEISVLVTKLPFDDETKRVLLAQSGLCVMLYRGIMSRSDDPIRPNSIGLAVFSPELELLARHAEPVLVPEHEFDSSGFLDGHLTKVGRRFIFTYTVYQHDSDLRPHTAMASTTDFMTWVKHGLIRGAVNDRANSNAMIFERKIGSRFMLLYHPTDGDHADAVHWAEGEDVYREWRPKGFLIRPVGNPGDTATRVRAGAPPMKLPDGRFVILYNVIRRKADGTTESLPGIALGDAGFRHFVVRRYEPLAVPRTAGEAHPTEYITISGAYLHDGGITVAYATPDNRIRGFRIPPGELDRFCRP